MNSGGLLALADGRRLVCHETLRDLPGKRLVQRAEFEGAPVVVKRFLDRRRGRVHWQRERDGLAALHAADIAAPTVLHAGDDADGRPLLILAWIDGARPFAAAWEQADSAQRNALLQRMMRLLAEHHAHGIQQTDLHLRNFLLAGDRLYTLDGDGVDARDGGLNESDALANLALFCSQFPVTEDARLLAASAGYARARGWPVEQLREHLPRLVETARLQRWRKLREKLYRECSAIHYAKSADREIAVVRSHVDGLAGVLSDIDATCPADPSLRLKNGNTATVWQIDVDGPPVVIKRYNVKGPLHGAALSLKESRASLSWRNAHMLRLFGIPTPAPLAYLRRRDGVLRPVAYFLSEAVIGESLRDWVAQHAHDPPAIREMAQQLAVIFAQLRRLNISHGDTKAANFIVTDEGPCVIDLDAMRMHRLRAAFLRSWQRDMRRFMANWQAQPGVAEIMRGALREAGAI